MTEDIIRRARKAPLQNCPPLNLHRDLTAIRIGDYPGARTLAASSDHPKTDTPYLGRPADPQNLLPLIPGHYESGVKWFKLVFDPMPEAPRHSGRI